MTPGIGNLFANIPENVPEELFEPLVAKRGIRVERIVSLGQASPEGFWYDQNTDEWVLLLAGAARLQIEGHADVVEMKPGSYVLLPAHQRHRVAWTDPDQATVWLAIHWTEPPFE